MHTYSNERSGASVKMARENEERRCRRVRLARFTLEDHAYGALRLPKTSKTTVLQSRILQVPE